MTAWTVATPDVMPMAEEAKRRIKTLGEIKSVFIFQCATKQECHRKKLELWLEFTGPTWMFDSDLWMLQKCSLGQPAGPILIGNPDNLPGAKYDGTNVSSSQAINSSLVGMDMGHESMRDLIKRAIELQQIKYGNYPSEDEKFLNIALWQKTTMFSRLSTSWNWCSAFPPSHAIAVHAASQEHKIQWLETAVKNYEERTNLD